MLTFPREGLYLETNRGLLDIRPNLATIFVPKPQPVYTVFLKGNWISQGEVNLLWLPVEYRPSCSAFRSNLLVLGCPSGLVTFLQIKNITF